MCQGLNSSLNTSKCKRTSLIVSNLLKIPRHLVELIEPTITQPLGQGLEHPDLFGLLHDGEVHQQGLQQIQQHVQDEEDYHEGIHVGFVLLAIEETEDRYPDEPVEKSD